MQRLHQRLVLLFLTAMVSCRSPIYPGAAKPNVLLITIDTLRADHLSCYGYATPTSPFLDQLASEGVRFENAYSACSWTAPSMASLFTALYPRQHGVRHGVVEEKTIMRQEYLDDRFLTLAELMKAAGYETFAVHSNGHTSREPALLEASITFRCCGSRNVPLPTPPSPSGCPVFAKRVPSFSGFIISIRTPPTLRAMSG
jgi:hypothetical protein